MRVTEEQAVHVPGVRSFSGRWRFPRKAECGATVKHSGRILVHRGGWNSGSRRDHAPTHIKRPSKPADALVRRRHLSGLHDGQRFRREVTFSKKDSATVVFVTGRKIPESSTRTFQMTSPRSDGSGTTSSLRKRDFDTCAGQAESSVNQARKKYRRRPIACTECRRRKAKVRLLPSRPS